MLPRKSIPELIVVIVIIMVYTPLDPYVYADTCGVEGNGMQVYILGRNECWLFTWSGEKTIKQKTERQHPYFEERLNRYSSLGDKRSLGLPHHLLGPDARLDVPFDMSKDSQMLIASVHPNNAVLIPSQKIALIALINKTLVSVIETDYGVNSLAWSPAGKYFAVLLSEDATRKKWKGPLDWISRSLGHPIPYNTLYIEIYNSEGKFVCRKVLMKKLAYGRGYIDWQ